MSKSRGAEDHAPEQGHTNVKTLAVDANADTTEFDNRFMFDPRGVMIDDSEAEGEPFDLSPEEE